MVETVSLDPGGLPADMTPTRPLPAVVEQRTTPLCTCEPAALFHAPVCPDVADTALGWSVGFVPIDPATPIFDALEAEHPGLRVDGRWLTVGQLLARLPKTEPVRVVLRDERGRFVSIRTLSGAHRA